MMFTTCEVWGSGGPSVVPLQPFKGANSSNATATAAVSAPMTMMTTPESRALQQAKNEITFFYEEGKWDDYKKITNPYEYIFLSWNRRSSRSVATRQPLSRSYFKMIELWKKMELDDLLEDLAEKDGGLVTAHAAEGPGGFLEACDVKAFKQGWNLKAAHAITLLSEAKNVPGWRKAVQFLEDRPQIQIHTGADGTGNILLKANQDAFVANLRAAHPDGAHLFTADGGFDFSNDYNAQEDSVFPLLLAEVLIGLRVLGKGGAFVIKCFDTREQPTLDLIWLVSCAFREWGVVKPRTSRGGNAERYIIGKGFLGDSEDVLAVLEAYQAKAEFKQPVLEMSLCDGWKKTLGMLAGLQEAIEHMEIEVIQETLNLIKHTEPSVIKLLVKSNVMRSIEWCQEHDEEVAFSWISELEKNVSREANDLLHILNPSVLAIRRERDNAASTAAAVATFESFRSEGSVLPPSHNPFMRLKATASAAITR